MICGFCGISISPPVLKYTSDIIELKSETFCFQHCEHKSPPMPPEADSLRVYVQSIREQIIQQLKSIEEIESILSVQKSLLLNHIRQFCQSNFGILKLCDKFSIDFSANFARLKSIKVDSLFSQNFKPEIQDYFDKEQLFIWRDFCLKESQQIKKKVGVLENEFYKDFENQLNLETENLKVPIQQIKNRFELQKLLFSPFGRVSSPITSSENQNQHLETIADLFGTLHNDVRQLVRQKSDKLKSILKKTSTRFNQSCFLISENVEELKNDSKIISVFDEMDVLIQECFHEAKQRSKFHFYYFKILGLLNQFARNENTRRNNFVRKVESKIPAQIFPEIRQMAKIINLELLFKDEHWNRIFEQSSDDLGKEKLSHIQEIIGSFSN